MPYRPLVSKIRVHNPNKVRASVANKNYVKYIATREGVALDDPENIDELLESPGMEKVNMNEQLIHDKVSNDNYLRYIACRPRSHGLFGNVDTSNLNAVMKEVSDVSKQNRVIYRGIISLSEKDAEELNFKNTAAWNQYLKKVMPGLAKELGISATDHTWVAAFHGEKSHPHVHYELWDNNDKVKSPFIHTSTQKKCREFLSKEMFDNEYEKMISKVYQEELEELKDIRNRGRNSILQKSERALEQIIYTPGITYEMLPDKISHEEAEGIKSEINELVHMMNKTEHGRISYKLLSEEMKDQVSKIAGFLYNRADIQREMEKYIESVGKMQQYYGKTSTEKVSAESFARKDMHYRICNKILKIVKGNYDLVTGLQLENSEMLSQIKSLDKEVKKQLVTRELEVKSDIEFSKGVEELKTPSERNMSNNNNQYEFFDINVSYVLIKTVLEDIKRQSMIQKSRAFEYDKMNISHSRQSIIEEIKKQKDNGREPF